MITKEQLLMNSSMAKYMFERTGRQNKGVLTFDEAKQRLEQGSKTIQVYDNNHEKENIFFYTDDYCLGVNLKEFDDKCLGPSTTVIPHSVSPRSGIEDGWVKTLEDYEFIYCKGKRRLESIDELIEYLNS